MSPVRLLEPAVYLFKRHPQHFLYSHKELKNLVIPYNLEEGLLVLQHIMSPKAPRNGFFTLRSSLTVFSRPAFSLLLIISTFVSTALSSFFTIFTFFSLFFVTVCIFFVLSTVFMDVFVEFKQSFDLFRNKRALLKKFRKDLLLQPSWLLQHDSLHSALQKELVKQCGLEITQLAVVFAKTHQGSIKEVISMSRLVSK